MTFIDEKEIIVREEVEQTVGPFACFATVEVTAVVLDARAMAQFLDHLHIIFYALLNTLGLDAVALFLEESNLLYEVILNIMDGDVGLLLRGHEEIGGVEAIVLERSDANE